LVWLFVQQRSSSSHGGWQRGRHGVGGVIVGDDVRGVWRSCPRALGDGFDGGGHVCAL
jgi:hypothetical protein